MKPIIHLLFGLFAIIATSTESLAQKAGDFDYYVLALSWSPTYCADDAKKGRDHLQCFSKKNYGFVVHGLWPQYNKGYPEYCDTNYRKPSPKLVDQMLKYSPSKGLIHHEWKKHGTCTGLKPLDYFRQAVKTFKTIKRPEKLASLDRPILMSVRDVRKAFLDANPDMPKDGLIVTCRRQKLREVRICFDKKGDFKSCSASVLRSECRQKDKLRILAKR